jgi:NTP pyrophosphatase (non-canonical NTP hydrolase)
LINTYTLRNIPFRIMRPTLKTLMASVLMVFAQVADDLRKSNVRLAAKIISLRDVTNKSENPTRQQMQTYLAAWYGVALELIDAIDSTQPELAGLLRNVVKECEWLQPAWEYMKGQMEQWGK